MNAAIWSPPWYRRILWRLVALRRNGRHWLTQRAINLVVWLNRDSNYLSHVRREVPEWFKESGPNRWMADGTVELLSILSHQGHSGGSVGFAVEFFSAMARFKPWGPLTGADDEWGEPNDYDGSQQNKRCGHVFRNADGQAYDIQGRIFREADGCCYTNKGSHVDITFPYTPKTEYVDVQPS